MVNRDLDESSADKPRIKRQALVEEVYNLIRADILSLRIPPDTRILVDDLVHELGVSQTPVREALSMLEGVGLVSKKHFIGYCTSPTLNRKQFDELYEMRLLIEPYAARCAASRMSRDDLEALSAHAGGMEPGHTRASYARFADHDSEFHARLADGSGNILVAEALRRLHTHMHIFRLHFHSQIVSEAASEHDRLIKALEKRDPDGAEAAMQDHIKKSYYRLAPFAGN